MSGFVIQRVTVSRLIFAFIVSCVFLLPQDAKAEVLLRLYPDTVNVSAGAVVPVGAFLSSTEYSVNAASAIISFPADMLEIVSIDDKDSIFDFWVERPSYSNDTGTVKWSGIAFSPGFKGTLGGVMTMRFRAKSSGEAEVRFVSNLVLANDGRGTELAVDDSNTAMVTVSAAPPAPYVGTGTGSSSTIDEVALAVDTSQQSNFFARNISAAELVLFLLLVAIIIIMLYNAHEIRRIERIRSRENLLPDDKDALYKLKKNLEDAEKAVSKKLNC